MPPAVHVEQIEWIEPALLAERWRGRGLAWLDGDGGPAQGRWSFVGCEPVEVVEGVIPRGAPGTRGSVDPAIVPRWVGYVAYDAIWEMREAIGVRVAPRIAREGAPPAIRFARFDAIVALDASTRRAFVVGDDARAVERALDRIEEIEEGRAGARVGDVRVEDAGLHRRAVARAIEAIAAGEIYQVNLVRRWAADYDGDPIALFLAMRRASPVPFGAYLEGERATVLARSMERFLRFDARDRSIETRPIKGTIAREGDDASEAARLRGDAKERAEHAMIVDLMRNDLGRIAEIGSVRAEDVMSVEPYAGLSHLVSTVRAIVRPEIDLEQILEATFPPGSITGTPKSRAIEIIEELERHPRGVSFGAIGHVDREGGLSLAVAIRTATVIEREAIYSAGGGIVEASDVEREVAETELKARVFLDAIEALREDERGGRAKKSAGLSGVV